MVGWEPDALQRLPLAITRNDEGGTRLRFVLEFATDDLHTRLYLALEAELPGLVERLNNRMVRCEAGCAA